MSKIESYVIVAESCVLCFSYTDLTFFGLTIFGFEDHVWFEDRWMVASLCDE
jgi:hypothetical protein